MKVTWGIVDFAVGGCGPGFVAKQRGFLAAFEQLPALPAQYLWAAGGCASACACWQIPGLFWLLLELVNLFDLPQVRRNQR